MRVLKSILFVAILSLVFTSCSDNEEEIVQQIDEKAVSITNLYAPAEGHGAPKGGDFVKFSFKEGKQVTGSNWDIAFRATEIIVNGGTKIGLPEEINRTGNAAIALVEAKVLADIKEAPEEAMFKQDAKEAFALPWGSEKGWYKYSGPPKHSILPMAGKFIVVKTIDGNYAKMEIRSYYKDSPKDPDYKKHKSRYYTFDYVYNGIKDSKTFQ